MIFSHHPENKLFLSDDRMNDVVVATMLYVYAVTPESQLCCKSNPSSIDGQRNKSSVNLVELGWFLLSLTESNMSFINFPEKVWRTFYLFSEVFRTSGAVFSYIHHMNVYIYNCKLRKNLL